MLSGHVQRALNAYVLTFQHVLRANTISHLEFVSYINQKLRPSYQTALNLHILKISGRSARERAEQLATGGDH